MRIRTRVKQNKLGLVSKAVKKAGGDAVVQVAEDVLSTINGEGSVPYEEGTLARSGEVVAAPDQGKAAITYDTPYAVVQHEDSTLSHPRQGQDHWLERTVEDNAQRYFEYIADHIRRETSG